MARVRKLRPAGGWRRGAAAMAPLALTLALALAACGDTTPLDDASDSYQMIRGLLLGTSKGPRRDEPAYEEEYDPACPKMEIVSGNAYYAVYPGNAVPEPNNVQFQARLDRTARECRFLSDQVAIKFGFSGRLLLGPKGAPGSVTLPLTVSFAGKGDKVVWSKDYQVPVSIAPGEESKQFVHIADDLVYQFRPGEDPEVFRLYVSFKETEGFADRGRRRR